MTERAFPDYFANGGHECLPDAQPYLKKLMKESDDAVVIEGVLNSFESQIGAFLRGFLTGHGNMAGPDELTEAVINNACPTCVAYWIEHRNECCAGHAIIHFMEAVLQDNILLVDASDVSHGDPTLN